MAEVINMPKLGFDMQEGTFAAWIKNVGDQIEAGDILAEIETDKATVEVETYAKGVLLHVMAEPGDIVAVGAPIAIVGAADENYEALLDGSGAAENVETPAKESEEPAPISESASTSSSSSSSSPSSGAPAKSTSSSNGQHGNLPGGVKASPVARRVADDKGVDLAQVQGTGPEGRIIKRDVEQFKPGAAPAAPSAAPSAPAQKGAPAGIGVMPSYAVMSDVPHEVIPTSRLRATIARRMVESKQFVPHFMVTTAMDTTALLALRKQINERLDDNSKVTVNDLVIKAAAVALRAFPNLNTHYHGEELVRYTNINIGIAVALPQGGLMNVVAKNADTTALSVMAAKNKKMISAAREGKVRPEDIEGSTFTVSNLGAFGVEHFTAIINPPEAGILAVGASQRTPVVNVDGEITIGNIMKCTLSVDHRVSDGAEGAEYMKYFKELIEDPMRLLV